MVVSEIEQAITELSPEEFDARVWDDQFESDVKSGKLDKIADKAKDEYRAGKAKKS
ncbi:MAG TPA: hypothetical protein VFO91_03745 [Anaerolineales bacterium]|nr:hypothetical protein [Anaerolineales bacterium]